MLSPVAEFTVGLANLLHCDQALHKVAPRVVIVSIDLESDNISLLLGWED